MRTRTTVPVAAAAALLAAALAVPAQALAEDNPTATPTDSPTATDSPSPTDSPTATPTDTPTDTPTATPTDTPVTAPTVGQAQAIETDAGTVLTVQATGADGVTAALTPTTGGDATQVTLTQQADGSWQSAPLDLPAYGSYTDAVTATNAGGPTTADGQSVDYYPHPVFSNTTITPGTLSYGSQYVTATGTLTTYDPRTGKSSTLYKPAQSGPDAVQVTLNGPGSNWNYANAGLTSHFSIRLNVADPASAGTFSLSAVDFTNGSRTVQGPAQTILAKAAQTRLVLSPSSVSVVAGRPVTFGGTVQYLDTDGATWKPAAGVPVKEYVNGAWQTTDARTDATGDFHFSATAPNAPTTWKAALDSASPYASPYLLASSADFRISAVTQQVSLRMDGVSVDEDSNLHFLMTVGSTNSRLPYGRIYLQVSPDGRTGWKNYDYFTGSGTVSRLKLAEYVANPHGWYRLYYPGTTGYGAAYSNTTHVFRYETQVTGGKPSTTSIAKNHYLSFSGHVNRRGYGSWSPLARTTAYLLFRPTGSKTWSLAATTRTDSHGYYRFSRKATRSGTWVVVWMTPNQWYVDSNGPETWVRVR